MNKCQFGPKPGRQMESSWYKEAEKKVVLKFAKKKITKNSTEVSVVPTAKSVTTMSLEPGTEIECLSWELKIAENIFF